VVLAATPHLLRKERAVRVGQPSVSEVLTILFAVYSGLVAARNIPVAAVLLALVVGPLVPQFARGFSERMAGVETQLRGHVWAVVAVVVSFLVAVSGGRMGAAQLMDAHFDAARMPVGAVDYLERQRNDSPIFSPDYWGGYLIYRFCQHPGAEARVVVDDRHDLYGENFLKEYLKVMHVEEGWKDSFLNGRRVGWLVLPRDGALANALVGDSQWKPVYRDDVAVVFRNESKADQQGAGWFRRTRPLRD
jgi:hypothetical protein